MPRPENGWQIVPMNWCRSDTFSGEQCPEGAGGFLTEENTLLQQDKYELNELRGLLELDEEYGDYNKIGARIISRDSGNWYSSLSLIKALMMGWRMI